MSAAMKRMTPSRLPLFWQLFLPNAAVLVIAVAILAFSPVTVPPEPSLGQLAVLFVGLVTMVLVNLALIRRAVRPVEQLTQVMQRVDPLNPGERVRGVDATAETADLAEVFNSMIDRLETERRDTAVKMLAAQEGERKRLARELHDQIGQSITGLMLEVDHAARHSPEEIEPELGDARETARGLSEELRRIVRRLRPEALDDLGLASALAALIDGFRYQSGVSARHRVHSPLPRLSPEAELVIYRVAQEGLTNVARHAKASEVVLELRPDGDALHLTVTDDGLGLRGAPPGAGITGMRERALLVNARMSVESRPEGGVIVSMLVPIGSGGGES